MILTALEVRFVASVCKFTRPMFWFRNKSLIPNPKEGKVEKLLIVKVSGKVCDAMFAVEFV
jgi:hypothetical protein